MTLTYCDNVKSKVFRRCVLLPNFRSPDIVFWCTRFPNTFIALLILWFWNVWFYKCNGSLCGNCWLRLVVIPYFGITFPQIMFPMDVPHTHRQIHD